jgi:G3E family GTPase
MTARPVSVITGYLGSGKTTLLNDLLRQPAMADTAVVINEFGEVAIDHLLVETSLENAVVLQSGCICCTVRGDLVDTLTDLEQKRVRGLIPPFSRVLVETTGLADPAPILQTLATEPVLAPIACAGSIITTVDAVNGVEQIRRFPEPVAQIALADTVVITKTDIADAAAIAGVRAAIARINPTAHVITARFGRVDADVLLETRTGVPAGERWMADVAADATHIHQGHDHDHDAHEVGHGHHHGSDPTRHDHGIRATSIVWTAPLPWAAVSAWLRSLLSLRGSDVLRLKGVIDVDGVDSPVAVHAIHHLLHPPMRLGAWPAGPRISRIVVIGRGLDPVQVTDSFERFAQSGGKP